MAQDPISRKSAFERAAANVAAKRSEPLRPSAAPVAPRTSAQTRAPENLYPDDTMLHGLIDKALTALSRGVRWARGSILNLLV